MEVASINLTDFRNYISAEAFFAPGFNLVVGKNGRGKTNLLESIYVLSALASHRTSSLSDVVRHGEDRAVVRSKAEARGRQVSIDAEFPAAGGPRVLINKVALGRAREAADTLATVLFSPEDLGIVKGGPEQRRRFLDHAAAKARPLAGAERQQFERVLKQRNGVLRAGQINPRALRTLDVWDEQLSAAAAAVVKGRLGVLSSIGPSARKRYEELSGCSDGPEFVYKPSWAEAAPDSEQEVAAMILEVLEMNRGRDLERGLTLAGPHRDDLAVKLEGTEARLYASQGEQRSLSLALRLAEKDLVADARGEEPVLLLDDVFSELDDARREQLAALVAEGAQTIATATGKAGIPVEAGRVIVVEEGGRISDE